MNSVFFFFFFTKDVIYFSESNTPINILNWNKERKNLEMQIQTEILLKNLKMVVLHIRINL